VTEVALAVGAVVLLGAIALLPFFVSFLNDLEAKVAKLRAVVPDAHDLAAAGRPPAEPVGDTGAAGSRRDHAE
jgi:hypothetical protein